MEEEKESDTFPILNTDIGSSSTIDSADGELQPRVRTYSDSSRRSSFRSTTGVKLGLKVRIRNSPRGRASDQKVVLNVGGKRFITYLSTLQNVPHTRLAELNELDACFDTALQEYFFDRNPKYFADILDFYRNGELHFSHCLCGPAIVKELVFWGIEETSISSCCWRAYKQYEDEKRTLAMLDETSKKDCKKDNAGGNCKFHKFQTTIWNFLEKPQTSKAAQVWAIFMLLVTLLSIAGLTLETHPTFRVPKTINTTENITCSENEKRRIFETTKPCLALVWCDNVCVLIFGAELLVRFLSCPKKSRFLFSFYNISDMLCVIPMFIIFTIRIKCETFWEDKDVIILLVYLTMTSVLRVFRLFKLARHYRCLKILQLAFRSSMRELLLLFMLILMGMLIFSTLIYFAEFEVEDNFEHIPIGFWWTIVTMTTVGYGDYVPKSGWGYLVGSMCGIFGMLATGLPIPIIASNFSHFYSFERYRKQLLNREELKEKVLTDRQADPRRKSVCRWSILERKDSRVWPFVINTK